MKLSLHKFLAVIALGAVAVPAISIAQDGPPPAEKKGGGRGGRMSPEQQVERLDRALTLTADQKAKILAIYKEQVAAMEAIPAEERREKGMELMKATREKVRAALTAEQQKKFDDMPPMGGRGPGGPRPEKKDN